MFWQGKRVLVTTPTSFLGAWTALSLYHQGAQVFGFGEANTDATNLFDVSNLAQKISMTYGDVRDEQALREALNFAQADVVLHLGESGFLFDEDRKSPELFAKSVVGTSLLLELLRETASVRSVVVVSSDKVYAKSAEGAVSENSLTAANEILPTARLCSELVALSYRQSFFNPEKYNKHKIALATARLGAGIGGGDFAARSFVFEAVESLRAGSEFNIRHPHSQRSWIHVLDQVRGILTLAQSLYERGPKLAPTYNLTESAMDTVGNVYAKMQAVWGNAPVSTGVAEARSYHALVDSSLALADLNWQTKLDVDKAIALSVDWYRSYFAGDVLPETDRQLAFFFGL
jgi:CDP-glucose 4,6-dehydratase